jgi:predicted unusual protein kinase regulating ubiquinone biosynthesis (AarF/ABC1/UbiB family)
VAQKLHELFITGLYDLHAIHADPNPGNFIIGDDLTIGLVDFGCIKRLDPDFVAHWRIQP